MADLSSFAADTAPASASQDLTAGTPAAVPQADGAPVNDAAQASGEQGAAAQARGPKGAPDPDFAFKRVQYENNQLKRQMAEQAQQMQAMMNLMQQLQGQSGQMSEAQREQARNIMDMSDEELDEMWHENKKGFLATYAQQYFREAENKMQQLLDQRLTDQQAEAVRKQQFVEFVNANPDFTDLFYSGAIEQYMQQYPGATEREAYYALTRDSQQQQAAEKARQAALSAKAGKAHLPPQGGYGASPPLGSEVDPRIKNPEQHGGEKAALASWFKDFKAGRAARV